MPVYQRLGARFGERVHEDHSRRFHDHGDSARLDSLLHCDCDLLGQAFLDLEPAGKGLCDTGEFRDAEDEVVGDVSDGDLGQWMRKEGGE